MAIEYGRIVLDDPHDILPAILALRIAFGLDLLAAKKIRDDRRMANALPLADAHTACSDINIAYREKTRSAREPFRVVEIGDVSIPPSLLPLAAVLELTSLPEGVTAAQFPDYAKSQVRECRKRAENLRLAMVENNVLANRVENVLDAMKFFDLDEIDRRQP